MGKKKIKEPEKAKGTTRPQCMSDPDKTMALYLHLIFGGRDTERSRAPKGHTV